MARRASRAPSRPASPPPSRAAPQQQQRQASTSSVPARQQPAPPAPAAPAAAPAPQSSGPGFFAGMAQIAGGVAMGHAITGAVSGLMSSGDDSGSAQESNHASSSYSYDDPCAESHSLLLQCIRQNRSDMTSCQYVVDMFNDCQDSQSRLQ